LFLHFWWSHSVGWFWASKSVHRDLCNKSGGDDLLLMLLFVACAVGDQFKNDVLSAKKQKEERNSNLKGARFSHSFIFLGGFPSFFLFHMCFAPISSIGGKLISPRSTKYDFENNRRFSIRGIFINNWLTYYMNEKT
jgi:hypothetical protein